jgi:uncharacterized membrane protein
MARPLLGATFLAAGALHFLKPRVYEAVNAERFPRFPKPLPWARLPLQALLIAWVWRAAVRR